MAEKPMMHVPLTRVETHEMCNLPERTREIREWLNAEGVRCSVSLAPSEVRIEVYERSSLSRGARARLNAWLSTKGLRVHREGNIGVRMGVDSALFVSPCEPRTAPVVYAGEGAEEVFRRVGRETIEHVLSRPRFQRDGIELLLAALDRQAKPGPSLSDWQEWTG